MSEMLLAARPRARVRPLFLARRWYAALSRPIANHEGIHPWGIDLIFLNALGLVLCVVLIAAAATNNDPLLVGQVTKGVKLCLRLFVAGAALPTVAWGICIFFKIPCYFYPISFASRPWKAVCATRSRMRRWDRISIFLNPTGAMRVS